LHIFCHFFFTVLKSIKLYPKKIIFCNFSGDSLCDKIECDPKSRFHLTYIFDIFSKALPNLLLHLLNLLLIILKENNDKILSFLPLVNWYSSVDYLIKLMLIVNLSSNLSANEFKVRQFQFTIFKLETWSNVLVGWINILYVYMWVFKDHMKEVVYPWLTLSIIAKNLIDKINHRIKLKSPPILFCCF